MLNDGKKKKKKKKNFLNEGMKEKALLQPALPSVLSLSNTVSMHDIAYHN